MKVDQIVKLAKSLLPDTLMLVGIVGISYGSAMIYQPAGWIAAGCFSLALGVLLARRGGDT